MISGFRDFVFRLCMLGRGGVRTEEGSSLVELALTMPILIVLVLGAAELGWVTYAAVEVANAARAGVSYGCQTSATAGDITGIQNTAAADAPDIALGTTTVTPSCICSNGNAAVGGCGSPTACPAPKLRPSSPFKRKPL